MNFLAKHFFDYQSFINLPHTAVQMHKTPHSQAGVDPSAAWAPKDLHMAGKNQPAPAARANRNYHGDQRTGSHRHGRPSKLEFRNWGERHGELREEKIVPHKDLLDSGHRSSSLDAAVVPSAAAAAFGTSSSSHPIDPFSNEYFPRALKMHKKRHPPSVEEGDEEEEREEEGQEVDADKSLRPNPLLANPLAATAVTAISPRTIGSTAPIRVLLILTVTPHLDFISVTVKALRGLAPNEKDPLIHIRLFDGVRVLEERGRIPQSQSSCDQPTKEYSGSKIEQQQADGDPDERQLGQSFLMKSPNPLRLPFCRMAITLFNAPSKCGLPLLLGSCLLGPSSSATRGNSHWKQMIKKIGVPTAMWHDLVRMKEKKQQHSSTTPTQKQTSPRVNIRSHAHDCSSKTQTKTKESGRMMKEDTD